MVHFVTLDDQSRITELYCDEPGYAMPPEGAVAISDADGEALRMGFSNFKLVNGTVVEDITALFIRAKEHKLAEIEQARDFLCFSNVTALGHTWQADKRSQELLGQAIALAIAGLPLPSVWRDANNENMTVTALADLLTVAGAMAQQTQEAYAYSWTLKAQIDTASTMEQLQEITW